MENPYKEMYLRQLARDLELSPYATKKYADMLIKEGLIMEEKRAHLRYFKANIGNLFFKHLKISFNIQLFLQCGLVDFLREHIPNISSIVLFGSMAKGENDEKSDVDLVIMGQKRGYIDLTGIRKKIGREIAPHIFSWSEWNKKAKDDRAFYFEVISYGIPLYGELPLVK